MNRILSLIIILSICLSCDGLPRIDENGFEVFSIRVGKHSSTSKFESFEGKGIDFIVVFDESAKYNHGNNGDQLDINKLLGFSDCDVHHQEQSARIGWRWYNNELQILSYVYDKDNLDFELMGSIPLNTPMNMRILKTPTSYEFSGEGLKTIAMKRSMDCGDGGNYWLWPYFGGNRTTLEKIEIRIKREQIE